MDPRQVFCPNLECPARGQTGKGNIGIHSRKEGRFVCRQCGRTFTETKGTALYRLRTAAEVVRIGVTLIAHGCPLQAIVAAWGFDERTVARGLARAGSQSQAVHEHLVEQPRELGQVQADEIRVKRQGGVDGHGHDGQHPLVAGRGSEPKARPALDPGADGAGAPLRAGAGHFVLY